MVEVTVPAEEGKPMKVRMDGKSRLTLQQNDAAKKKGAKTDISSAGFSGTVSEVSTTLPGSRSRPTAEDEKRYPRASVILESLSAYASTTLASLFLLPLSLRKVARQVPLGQPRMGGDLLLSNFAGGRAMLGDSVLRFGATALFPPPMSNLVSYIGSIPLRGSVVRAQSGIFASARCALPNLLSPRGFLATWRAQLLRDIPFVLIETYFLASIVLGRLPKEKSSRLSSGAKGEASGRARGGEVKGAAQKPQRQGRRDSIQYLDAIGAATVAGVLTVPLDLLRTRMLVSGRPSAMRTSRAVFRLARQRGPLSFLSSPGGSGVYVAECMVRPIALITIYTVCRACLVSSWLSWKMRNETVHRVRVE